MRTRSLPPVVVALLVALSGCSEEAQQCTQEWVTCKSRCPTSTQEQAAIAQANTAYEQCTAACPQLNPNSSSAQQVAAGNCLKRCGDAKTTAIAAATACSDSCDDDFSECFDGILGCNDPMSTTNLVQVSVASWPPHTGWDLKDPSHGVFACDTHLPPFSAQRNEMEGAISQYSDLPGSAISLFSLGAPHQDKWAIFTEPAGYSTIDYVDNANDTFPHGCHPQNPTACGDLDLPDGGHVDGFSGNTCPYASGQWNNASPSTEFFAVTANGACFDYFSNPASSDYAKKGLWLHELGHSTGMVHSKNWPAADLKYISTMQGKLEFSSAYDVAFLRQNYPLAWPGAWRNFVASSKIRLDFGGPNEVSDAFAEENPAGIYLVGDEVYDCRTKQKAVWYAAWFNQGLDAQEPDHCMINQLRIESPATVREVVLKTIHAAPMPKESQDQWTGPAVVTAADFTGFPRGAQVDLVFEVNVYEQWRERNWDNIVRAPITLYSSSACMASVPATETAPIRLTSMGHYDIDRSYLNRLGASPEMMRRDVRLVPTKVGANVRYRVRSLDAAGIGASLGLKADDVLSTVDAQPVGPTTLQQGYLKLVSAGRLTVVVLRNGAPLTLHYRVV